MSQINSRVLTILSCVEKRFPSVKTFLQSVHALNSSLEDSRESEIQRV